MIRVLREFAVSLSYVSSHNCAGLTLVSQQGIVICWCSITTNKSNELQNGNNRSIILALETRSLKIVLSDFGRRASIRNHFDEFFQSAEIVDVWIVCQN